MMCLRHNNRTTGIYLLAVALFLSSCTGSAVLGHKTIDDALRASVTSFQHVLHQHSTDEGVIVFFQHALPGEGSRLGVAWLKELPRGWQFVQASGAVELNPEDGLSVAGAGLWGAHDGRKLCYGVVSNPDIVQVEVLDLRAQLPEAKNVFRARAHLLSIAEQSAVRLWFLTVKAEGGRAHIVRGLSHDGEVLVQNRC